MGDALQTAGLIRDDSQIVHWDSLKLYDGPGVYIRVHELCDENE